MAVLLRDLNEVKLVVACPAVHKIGKETVIRYHATVLIVPEGMRHVVVSYEGDAVFLVGQHLPDDNSGAACFALLVEDGKLQTPLLPSPLIAPSPAPSSGESRTGMQYRICAVRARRPLCQATPQPSNVVSSELILLTDNAVASVFHVSLPAKKAPSSECIWAVHLLSRYPTDRRLHDSLSVVGRWKTTSCFIESLNVTQKKACTPLPDDEYTSLLRYFTSGPVIICTSPNGAVMCVVPSGSPKAYLVGLGVSVNDSMTTNSTLGVPIPSALTVCDAMWVSSPLSGFLLLGSMGEHGDTSLHFLPLTGQPPQRLHIEQQHIFPVKQEGGLFSFFSLRLAVDVFGLPQLCLSIHYQSNVRHVNKKKTPTTAPPSDRELHTCFAVLPTLSHLMASIDDASLVSNLVRFSGFASFAEYPPSDQDPEENVALPDAGVSDVSNAGAQDQIRVHMPFPKSSCGNEQLNLELLLESHLDTWLRVVMPTSFLLTGVLYEILLWFTRNAQHGRFLGSIPANDPSAVLASVFQGVVEVLKALSVTSSTVVLRRYFAEVFAMVTILRRALALAGQYGAVSTCFSAAAHFAQLSGDTVLSANNASPGVLRTCCPEWRLLAGVLFDEAFVHVNACPWLASALLSHCSGPVQQMFAAGKVLTAFEKRRNGTTTTPLLTLDACGQIIRPLDEVLSLSGVGASVLSTLSGLDVSWAARRLFFSEGIDAAEKFLKQLACSGQQHNFEMSAICAEYEALRKRLEAVTCQV
ncbi:hypothetical protein ERJ75_000868700 [Trypanosoma vivax]|nr:hypothetical protein ERJ75_000868700 [Trypanosoma vivax]